MLTTIKPIHSNLSIPTTKPKKVFNNPFSLHINHNQAHIVTSDFEQFKTSTIEHVQYWYNKNNQLVICIDTLNTRYTFINVTQNNIVN